MVFEMRERLSLAELCVMCLLCVTVDMARGECVDLLTGQRYHSGARWSLPGPPIGADIWGAKWPYSEQDDFQRCRQLTCQSNGAVTVASCQTSPLPRGCSLDRSPRARLAALSPFPACCPVVLCPIGHPGPRPRPAETRGPSRSYDQGNDYGEHGAVFDEGEEDYPDEKAYAWPSEASRPLQASSTQEVSHTPPARRNPFAPAVKVASGQQRQYSPPFGDGPGRSEGGADSNPANKEEFLAYASAPAVHDGNTTPPRLEFFPHRNNYESAKDKTALPQLHGLDGATSSPSAESASGQLSVDGGAASDAGEGMSYSKADSTQLEFSSSVATPDRGSARPADTVARHVSSAVQRSLHFGLGGRASDQQEDAQQEAEESMGLVQAVMQKAGPAAIASQDNSAVMFVPKVKSVT